MSPYTTFIKPENPSSAIPMEPEPTLQPLRNIVPAAQNNINAKFILLDKGRVDRVGQTETCLALVADETAAVHFQLWGGECAAVEPGDILLLRNGIFSMAFVETPNLSEIHWAPDPPSSNNYVAQAVVSSHSRIFPPQ